MCRQQVCAEQPGPSLQRAPAGGRAPRLRGCRGLRSPCPLLRGARSPPGARALRAASPHLPPQDPGGFPARRRGAQPRHGGRAPGCRRGTAPAASRLGSRPGAPAAAAGRGRGAGAGPGGRGPGARTVKPAARASGAAPGAARAGGAGERRPPPPRAGAGRRGGRACPGRGAPAWTASGTQVLSPTVAGPSGRAVCAAWSPRVGPGPPL